MSAEPMLLMTPGPTRVPQRVLGAGARPMIHHRSPEFSRELAQLLELLGPVFGTRSPVLPVHTTGRGALEATICNLFSPGDEIAVCCNGKFGEMWAGFAESYGVHVHRISTDWSRSISAREVDAFLAEHPAIRAVALTYVDTSPGVANTLKRRPPNDMVGCGAWGPDSKTGGSCSIIEPGLRLNLVRRPNYESNCCARRG